MTPLVLAVAVGATYSLTLLVVCDKITDRPRQALLTRISGHGYAGESGPGAYLCACGAWGQDLEALLDHVHDARQQFVDEIPMTKRAALLYLFRCQWCASAWIAAPVLWSAWCFGTRAWWFIPAAALTARGVTGTWASFANPRK